MPDFISVKMYQCKESHNPIEIKSSSGKDYYTVSNLGYEYMPPRCTCKAYEFSKELHCKHIDIAMKLMCPYHQLTHGDPDEIGGELYCPLCGGEVEVVMVAV